MKYLPWLLLVIVSSLLTLEAKRLSNSVNRDDSDFEFVNENAEVRNFYDPESNFALIG